MESQSSGGEGVWGQVASRSSSTGDRAGSVSGESLTPAERTYLPFASKISLISDILRDKVPISVDSKEVTGRVTSLLSRQGSEKESTLAHLPLAAVVRSALSTTSWAMNTATRESPWSAKNDSDSLPLNINVSLRGRPGTIRYPPRISFCRPRQFPGRLFWSNALPLWHCLQGGAHPA